MERIYAGNDKLALCGLLTSPPGPALSFLYFSRMLQRRFRLVFVRACVVLMNSEDRDASVENIDRYREYLRFLARVQLGAELRSKLDPSDIVQQSLLQAHQARSGFRGHTEAELVAWLRRILSRTIAHATRDWQAQKREVDREQSIHTAVDASSARLEHFLAAEGSSPSQRAVRREHAVLVAEAVESLSAAQREAIVLRYWHALTLNEVAAALQKSPTAVAGLLHRGLKALRVKLRKLEST